jgi:hypothetical protein
MASVRLTDVQKLAGTVDNLTCASILGADHAYTHQRDYVWRVLHQWLEKVSEGQEKRGLRERGEEWYGEQRHALYGGRGAQAHSVAVLAVLRCPCTRRSLRMPRALGTPRLWQYSTSL